MKVNYWLKGAAEQNFGDALTAFFLSDVFICEAVHAPACRIIGSTIADFIVEDDLGSEADEHKGVLVYWGAGLRDANSLSAKAQARCEFRSVRGPLTRDRLGLDPSVPIGDPALLLKAVHQPSASENFHRGPVCIPHFNDRRSNEELLIISGAQAVLRPNIAPGIANVKKIIDAICAADFVLSASLHGAIVAAAYGKPFSFWDPDYVDLPFKWADFAASIGIEALFARTIDEGRDLFKARIQPRIKLPKLLPVLKAAPYIAKPEIYVKVFDMDHPNIIASRPLAQIVDAIRKPARPLSDSLRDNKLKGGRQGPTRDRPQAVSPVPLLGSDIEDVLTKLWTQGENTARKLDNLQSKWTELLAKYPNPAG